MAGASYMDCFSSFQKSVLCACYWESGVLVLCYFQRFVLCVMVRCV